MGVAGSLTSEPSMPRKVFSPGTWPSSARTSDSPNPTTVDEAIGLGGQQLQDGARDLRPGTTGN